MTLSAKRQRIDPHYELLYHPVVPGRGEYIRLVLEAAGVPYTDPANEKKDGYDIVLAACDQDSIGDQEEILLYSALRRCEYGEKGRMERPF